MKGNYRCWYNAHVVRWVVLTFKMKGNYKLKTTSYNFKLKKKHYFSTGNSQYYKTTKSGCFFFCLLL